MGILIQDLYDSNVNNLLAELRGRLSRVQSARASAEQGGDFEETLTAYVRTLHAAINAVEKQSVDETDRAA